MANKLKKHAANVPGRFYCTSPDDPGGEGCTACTICYTAAPDFFAEDSEGYAYVMVQPETESDIELCLAQLEACPPSAIGKDG
jgi:ferredoxin